MDILDSVKIVFYFALTVLALSLLPIIYQTYHIVLNARRISDRIELLSDVRGWVDLARKFTSAFRHKGK